jgi:hypothetical protein
VLSVVRDAVSGRTFNARTGERAYLFTESGRGSYSFHLAPRAIEYGNLAQSWVESKRSGREPLLMREGDKLETLKFSFLMVETKDATLSMADSILALKGIARSRERVLFAYSRTESGLWRITDATVTSEYRHALTDEPIRAAATVTLTRASDPAVAVGPVTGGTRPAPGPPAPAPPRTYTVVKGDCLWFIAQRYWGKGQLWPRIFDANRNKIRDPHWIFPGQVFVIP